MTRKAIGKALRFEVFKRDGFKCQYCGAEAPKVVLHVDHINPVAKGGTNDLLNLITSCFDCNSGKSDRVLSDDSAVAKQRAQLDDLHERREQMEMMLQWREGMTDLLGQEVKAAQRHFTQMLPGWRIENDNAVKSLKKFIKDHGLSAVLDAIDVAIDRYVKSDDEGTLIEDSVQKAWSKVGGILHIGAQPADRQRLHYVKGILNNRLPYVPKSLMQELEAALDAGTDVEDMVAEAKTARSWTVFRAWLIS